jgi:hypothetical protein
MHTFPENRTQILNFKETTGGCWRGGWIVRVDYSGSKVGTSGICGLYLCMSMYKARLLY